MDINKIKALRKMLHNNPEVGLDLKKSKEILINFIKDNTNNIKIVDKNFYFYCTLNEDLNNDPIAFRADYDALNLDNNIGHFCGHDGHASILAGLILELDKLNINRTIYFIFQSGEEDGSGAKLIVDDIKDLGIKEIYALHNIPGYKENSIIVLDNTFASISTGLELEFTGSVSHAAYPNLGINPSNAISKLVLFSNDYVKEHKDKLLLSTVIGISVGSNSYGVSAGSGILRLTLRAEEKSDFDLLVNEIINKAKYYAKVDNLELNIKFIDTFPVTKNSLAYKVEEKAKELNYNIIKPSEAFRWSEDFGYFLYEINGSMFGVGVGENYPGLHKTNYEFNDEIILNSINLFKSLI